MTGRAAALLVVALGSALPLAAQSLHYEGGLSVATGRYIFAERTTSWSLATGLALGSGPVTVRMTWPVYLQNSTLISISGPAGSMPTGGSSSGAVADSGAARKGREDGQGGGGQRMGISASRAEVEVPGSAVTDYALAVGDPTAQLTWRALDGRSTAAWVSLQAKAPVADTATFGTGQWDVGGAIGVSRRLGTRAMAGLEVAYWHLGDLEALDFSDPVYGTATLTYLGASGWGGGLSLTGGTAALEGYDGAAWVGLHLSRSAGAASWGLTGSIGLTETTPDLTLGLSWRVPLRRTY